MVGATLRAAAPRAWFLEDEVAGLDEHVGPGAVCFDIGAEYGLYTWTLAGLVGPSGRVHAVEPQPGPASFLRASRRALGAEQVTVHETALGADGGHGTLSRPVRRGVPVHGRAFLTVGANGLGSNREFDRHDEMAVSVRTLDDLVDELGVARIDFVKVDIEGAEAALLAGARGTLERFAPTLMLELEDRHLERFGTTVAAVRADLADLGYTALHHRPGAGWVPAVPGPSAPRNVLFVPRARG
jgi:FkbM family methyltransferase